MKHEIQKLVDDYASWVKNNTFLRNIGTDWAEITTPTLDRHNDMLQIYIRKEGSGYLLTDDGYILEDLECSGFNWDSSRRQELLNTTLAGFGVFLESKSLSIRATQSNFPIKKHNLLQAMVTVNDMFYLSSPFVSSLFYEDVISWLDKEEIRFSTRIKFTGKSGYDHMFDALIPKSKNSPERIVQTMTNPKKDAAENLVFKWMDTRETRIQDSKLFAFLNDENIEVHLSVVDALKNYDLVPVLWSERDKYRDSLAA